MVFGTGRSASGRETTEGYEHRSGVHCGAAALRNLSQYYGWNYTEAACFGIGGPAFVLYEHPDEAWENVTGHVDDK